MERVAVQAGGRAITAEQIRNQLLDTSSRRNTDLELETLLQLSFHESVAKWERRLVERVLDASNGNKI
jgi:hypothetical protein